MQLRENLSRTKSVTVDPDPNSIPVVVLSKIDTGFAATDAFDVRVKGRTILPPLGPIGVAIHAARQPDQTLTADAKKLVDRIVKRLSAIPDSATEV